MLRNAFELIATDSRLESVRLLMASMSNRFSPSSGSPVVANTAGTTTIYTPAAGKRIRLKWVGLSTPPENGATTEVTMILGGTPIYQWSMGAPGAFAHGAVREGPVDGTLTVTMTVAQRVLVNVDLEEF